MNANGKWSGRQLGFCGLALSLLLSSPACAPAGRSSLTETADDPALLVALSQGQAYRPQGQGACVLNSVAGNGLSSNGLSGNGLCGNGLGSNGLDKLGLKKNAAFASWFNANPDLADVVMKYVYKCAAPAGASVKWNNDATNTWYSWDGGLGLAPGWAGGAAATLAEQQVITACLGALVNKYGVHVTIAVEGRDATGVRITMQPGELQTYSHKEAAFFGNLFTGEGIFACLDHPVGRTKSSVRACSFDQSPPGPSTICPPLYQTGQCADFCVHSPGGPQYESCTYNGVTYQPLTTRLNPSDIYTCGDGVCQMTEHCGTGTTPDSCKPDCGLCP